jgi:hypothetical protein
VMMNLEKRSSSHLEHLPKTLFILSRCRIIEDDGSRDLLSRSQMHIDERDKVALVAQEQRRKPRCVGGSWLFVVTSSVVIAHIYREGLLRVIVSRNRLGLSIKHRHGLTVKINRKRKSRTYEAPRHTQRGKRVHACVSPFLLSSTLLQVHRLQPTI